MTATRDTWPIAAGLLQFPGTLADGSRVIDADPEHWFRTFRTIAGEGFDTVELGDAWLRPADLAPDRLAELRDAADQAGVALPAVAVMRRSVIDPVDGDRNLDYAHRTIEAAAALGSGLVSLGLHRPLTPAQAEQLWFWTVDGPSDLPEQWDAAVARLRELGSHAAALGLQVSLEMYEDTFLGTADSAVRLVEEIGLDNVGLNPDIGNIVRLHRPIESWRALFERTLPYTNYWHIKNYFRDEDRAADLYTSSPAPLELGVIDYRWAIGEALRHGFTGTFVCEHYGGDGLSVAALNREYIRRMLPSGEQDPHVYVPRPATADRTAPHPQEIA